MNASYNLQKKVLLRKRKKYIALQFDNRERKRQAWEVWEEEKDYGKKMNKEKEKREEEKLSKSTYKNLVRK